MFRRIPKVIKRTKGSQGEAHVVVETVRYWPWSYRTSVLTRYKGRARHTLTSTDWGYSFRGAMRKHAEKAHGLDANKQ